MSSSSTPRADPPAYRSGPHSRTSTYGSISSPPAQPASTSTSGSEPLLGQPGAVQTTATPNSPTRRPDIRFSHNDDGSGIGGPSAGLEARPKPVRTSIIIVDPPPLVRITIPDSSNVPYQEADTASVSSKSSYSTYSTSSSCSLEDQPLPHDGRRSGAHSRTCSHAGDIREEAAVLDDECEVPSSRKLFCIYVGLAPILLAIMALFAGLLQLLPVASQGGWIVHWDVCGVGMIGWVLALALRSPIYSFFFKILHQDWFQTEWMTLLLAGLVEELVRLVVVWSLGIGPDFGAVYWLGLGWAGIETVYYIGQSLAYSRWLSDSDDSIITTNIAPSRSFGTIPGNGFTGEGGIYTHAKITKAEEDSPEEPVPTWEARHLLGIDRPWWSLMGRTSSMMVHIGFSCWIGFGGWTLLLPAALVHGVLYSIWGVFLPATWSVPATSYGTMMVAMAVFLIGLALYGQIV